MGSENSANNRIFFKDKQNELKGPYTERQVQEGYRNEYFEDSTPFYFMKEDKQPRENAEYVTLDTLRTHNGIGCPFKWIDQSIERIEEEKKREKQQRMNSIEKELAQLRVMCETLTELQKRLEEVKKRLEELPACIDGNAVWSRSEKKTTVPTVLPDLPATVPAVDENRPPWTDVVTAASDDVTSNANGKETEAASNEENQEQGDIKAKGEQNQQKDKKREDELKKFNEWSDYFADFYMIYLDSLETGEISKIIRDHAAAFARANHIMKREEARRMCVEKIVERLKTRELLNCSLCGCVSYNYKQFLIHCAQQAHISKAKTVPYECFSKTVATALRMMDDLRLRCKAEEDEFAAEIAEKYASVGLDESRLAPSKAFISGLEKRYAAGMMNGPPTNAIANSLNDVLHAALGAWKDEGLADRLMAELHEHIGTKLTHCRLCRVVTGTREEYYKHLMLTTHNTTVRTSSSSSLFHFQTITVNILKKDLVI